MEYIEELKKIDQDVARRIEISKIETRQYLDSQSAQKRSLQNSITIPVVVHVMHNGEQIGTGKNISDAQVISQIDVLNEDYNAQNGDLSSTPAHFSAQIGNPELEFCLATMDPQGNATTGIDRVFMGASSSWSDNMKPGTIWNSAQYLNIWVAQLSGSTLGYTTFPGSPTTHDGVVIDYRYFGKAPFNTHVSNFNLGRTATHELGHWLGLDHTFLSGCSGTNASNCSTNGDRICDTPPTRNANYGCSLPANQNTCTETPVDHPDMWMNFLDYMDDECLYMFTQGQVDIMRAVLNSDRSGILSSFACDNGSSSFSFTAKLVDSQSGLGVAGAKVLMLGPAAYELETDAGGYFNTPNLRVGTYSIHAGKWGYVTKEFSAGLTIDSNSATFTIPLTAGYYDDFLLDFGWTTSATAISGLWERGMPLETINNGVICNPGEDIAGDFGEKAFVTGNGGGSAGNDDVDDGMVTLTSPQFNLTGYADPYISYYRWFFNGSGQGTPDDLLTISISNGSSTVVIETLDVNTANANQWNKKIIRVKDYITPTSTMRLIVETGDQGNGHLVEAAFDGFQVSDSIAAGEEHLQSEPSLFIFPNPATDHINFDVREPGIKVMELLFFKPSGKIVYSSMSRNGGKITVDVKDFPAGMYFVKFRNNDKTIVGKFTIVR